MRHHFCLRQSAQSAPAAAVVVVVALLVVAVTGCGHGHRPLAGHHPTGARPASVPSARYGWQQPGTAEYVAARYVTAAHGFAWDQGSGVGGWVAATQPYDTPGYFVALEGHATGPSGSGGVGAGPPPGSSAGWADSGDGAFWDQVQASHEVMAVRVADAQVLREAPTSPVSEYVRVRYQALAVTSANPHPTIAYGGTDDVILAKQGSEWRVTGTADAGREG